MHRMIDMHRSEEAIREDMLFTLPDGSIVTMKYVPQKGRTFGM
jgi:hypothetical protein